jgi:hypothetical protein
MEERAMTVNPHFATTGNETEKIDVRLSYRIVRLFSEGLYVSPQPDGTTRRQEPVCRGQTSFLQTAACRG